MQCIKGLSEFITGRPGSGPPVLLYQLLHEEEEEEEERLVPSAMTLQSAGTGLPGIREEHKISASTELADTILEFLTSTATGV